MSDEPVFDPRHDAVFQRGYEAGSAPRTAPASEADAPAPARVAPAAASASEPERSTPRPDDSPRPNPADGTAPPLAELASTELHEASLVPQPKRSRFNPFIIGLWLLGPALAGGGIWLQMRQAAFSYASNGTSFSMDDVPWDVVYQQLVWGISPTMITAGVTTILGLLFWHAWRWRAARS